ncbi:MAG: amino acid ABC transporter substrate-binding protein [Zoogloeaceae bacterium]|nr:amino acid ABC transporter substrate-binding protein [Zoogloeaceae bacterium]
MNMNLRTILLAICLSLLPGMATAENTLEKIRRLGIIIIGHQLADMPFSYLDSSFQPTGYTKELCDQVVETIKREHGLPNLKTVYQAVLKKDRLPALQDGKIDLECGSTTDNLERRQAADFSITFFVSHIRMLTRKDLRFKDLGTLANKTIVVTEGTTSEQAVRERLDTKTYNIRVARGKTHSDSFLMLKSGRAAAYVMDDILLAGLIADSREPDAYEIVGPALSTERYAIMIRKGDAPLKEIVNKALADMMQSGAAGKLYDRWFMNPIPPSGLIMNLPMSEELSRIFASPRTATEPRPEK